MNICLQRSSVGKKTQEFLALDKQVQDESKAQLKLGEAVVVKIKKSVT